MEKITSRKNPLCIHFKKLGADRAYRESCGEFLCDGIKLLKEAEQSGTEIVAVLTSTHIPFGLPINTKLYLTDQGVINSLSPLKNAQNVLFSCKMPQQQERKEASGILLDGIQDPGNLGTIMRTAHAFGIKNIILTGDCADIYNPKTIRATMGAIFKQRIKHLNIAELARMKHGGVRLIGAVLSDAAQDFRNVCLTDSVVAIGSEGAGLSDDVIALCDEQIMIPISVECESLNAAIAAGIIMFNI
ncbi:MAG: RNA methyltransferase [Oscillospiraceae bacterium]|nr:RNA methyltransferase [Oscillospiraceae bacterium]